LPYSLPYIISWSAVELTRANFGQSLLWVDLSSVVVSETQDTRECLQNYYNPYLFYLFFGLKLVI
jgi:hypothetical protein